MKDGTYENIYNKWFGPDGNFPLVPPAKPLLPANAFGESFYFVWPD
jgi:polar amino acid transport system substrate-binding protein